MICLKNNILKMLLLAPLLILSASIEIQGSKTRLYAMDCGSLDVSDMRDFSDAGTLDGQKASLVNPCYLVRHQKGDLIWDTGYEESLFDRPKGDSQGAYHSKMSIRLSVQLAEIGLKPTDIEFLAVSHFHPDHSGNANLFSKSVFIANRKEHRLMFSKESRANEDFFRGYSILEESKTIFFDKTHDVFEDGSVIITSMPGHTPGSSVLGVRLNKFGWVLLSGDLYTHAKARELNTVPTFNMDKQETLKSRSLFEALAAKLNARVLIQHNKKDFEGLPKFPAFLD